MSDQGRQHLWPIASDRRTRVHDAPRVREAARADPEVVERWHRWSRVAGVVVAGLGVTVLAGWVFDVDRLKSLSPSLTSMKANTASGFVLLGASLYALAGEVDRRRRAVAVLCGAVVAMLGTLTLIEYAAGWDLRIDELLLRDAVGALQTSNPGRMAPTTAACFLGLGLALLLIDSRWRRVGSLLSLAVLPIALTATLGYLYGARSLYRLSAFTSMALHTALGMTAASIGILLLRPERAQTAVSGGAGGLMLRRAVPAAAATLVVVGEARILGQHAGYYGTEFGLALMVIASIGVLIVVLWMVARSLERIDEQRERAADDLRESGVLSPLPRT